MAETSPPHDPKSASGPPPRGPVSARPGEPPAAAGAQGPNLALPSFQRVLGQAGGRGLESLADLELDVRVEIGRSNMPISHVLGLSEGSVVELDRLAGEPVDVYVNEQLVARGQVLVVDDNFCVRISQIVADA